MNNSQTSFQLSDNVDQNKVFLVNLSDIEGRIDPIQFNSNRVAAIEKLSSNRILTKLSKVTISNSNKVDESDLVYVGLENIQSHTGEYIFTQDKNGFGSANIFNKGNILFPKLRPYLNKVYLAEFDGVCSTEFHVLDSKGNFLNEFLAIYLRSELILNQTKYLMTGNTLPRLQTKDIADLPVPVINLDIQKKIVDTHSSFMRERSFKIQQAENLLSSIDDYLLAELGIKVPDVDNSLPSRMFTVQASELSGGRFDAYRNKVYFQELQKVLENHTNGSVPLKKYTKNMASGQWGVDEEDGYDRDIYTKCLVIRATEFDNNGNLSFDENRIKYRLIENNKFKKMNILEHDLLIEKSGGSENQPVGRIAILTKNILNDYGNIAYSNFVQKITVNSTAISPVFLFYYLKTLHNIKFTEKMQSQTNGIRNLITSEYLDTPIINVDCQKQHEIVQHIDKVRATATQLQQEANEILAQAKQKIERMILGEEN